MRITVLLFSLALLGCENNANLSLNLKHLIKTSYKKPDSKCQELGSVTGIALDNAGFARSYQQALKSILRETHDKGGNFLFIERASTDGTNLAGMSYACND